MIPRVFHRIWLGADPMPDAFVEYGETWRRNHPDWEMRLWTETELPDLRHPEAFAGGRNHSERSNVLRYELLWQFGGVYIDTDMECLKSIEPLLNGVSVFAGSTRPGRTGSSIVGSVPAHPAFDQAVERVREGVGRGERQTEETGPGFLTSILAEHPDVTIFPASYFYPYRHDEKHLSGGPFPDAYAVHHWAKTWETYEDLRLRVERLQRKLAVANEDLAREREARKEMKARLNAERSSPGRRARGTLAAVAASLRERLGSPASRD